MWFNEYEKNEADVVKVLDWGELLKISQVKSDVGAGYWVKCGLDFCFL